LAYCQQQGLERFSGDGNLVNQQGWFGQKPDRSTTKSSIPRSWEVVSWAADCNEDDECSICGLEYAEECKCFGPTQDGIEYEEFDGVLYGRPEQFWPSRPGQPQHGWEPPRVVGNSDSKRFQERSRQGRSGLQGANSDGGENSNMETQPSMGRDIDGTAGGMDAPELYTTCDNRTDELRLLGNGVVPATAERAFRTLLTELLND
jgi:hypothetical protein